MNDVPRHHRVELGGFEPPTSSGGAESTLYNRTVWFCSWGESATSGIVEISRVCGLAVESGTDAR
jgi:hypothetical protein